MDQNQRREDDELVPWGWAPGGYMAICTTCGVTHYHCDKRAWACASCAQEGKIKYIKQVASSI